MLKITAVLLALSAFLGACGDDGEDEDLTLVERCVRDVEDLYEEHDLPFTTEEDERPGICEDYIAENEIETAAQWEILRRQIDKELDALD